MTDVNKADTTGTAPEDIIKEPSQDPLEAELQREEKRGTKSEPEKAAYTLQKNAERLRELGLDPAEILGLKTKEAPGTVMTVEMFEAMKKEDSQKTALQMADEIQDDHERNLTKKYLLERIVPSGDPNEDLRFARNAVNSVKNQQLLEEQGRKGVAGTHVSAPGAPAKRTPKEQELSAVELRFTRPPFNLTKEEIIAKRPQ